MFYLIKLALKFFNFVIFLIASLFKLIRFEFIPQDFQFETILTILNFYSFIDLFPHSINLLGISLFQLEICLFINLSLCGFIFVLKIKLLLEFNGVSITDRLLFLGYLMS